MNNPDVHSGSPHDRRLGRQTRLLHQLHRHRPALGALGGPRPRTRKATPPAGRTRTSPAASPAASKRLTPALSAPFSSSPTLMPDPATAARSGTCAGTRTPAASRTSWSSSAWACASRRRSSSALPTRISSPADEETARELVRQRLRQAADPTYRRPLGDAPFPGRETAHSRSRRTTSPPPTPTSSAARTRSRGSTLP